MRLAEVGLLLFLSDEGRIALERKEEVQLSKAGNEVGWVKHAWGVEMRMDHPVS